MSHGFIDPDARTRERLDRLEYLLVQVMTHVRATGPLDTYEARLIFDELLGEELDTKNRVAQRILGTSAPIRITLEPDSPVPNERTD